MTTSYLHTACAELAICLAIARFGDTAEVRFDARSAAGTYWAAIEVWSWNLGEPQACEEVPW